MPVVILRAGRQLDIGAITVGYLGVIWSAEVRAVKPVRKHRRDGRVVFIVPSFLGMLVWAVLVAE